MVRNIDKKDLELFRQATANVNPLKQDKVPLRKSPPRPHARQTLEDEKAVLEEAMEMSPHAEMESGDEVCYFRPGVQHHVIKKLKRGKYSVKAVLDLHGLYVREAQDLLSAFLGDSRLRGFQCVRVIHGKGRRSPHGKPVLKNKVFHWLRQRDEVLGFCSARRTDGGTGAVYILLKR